MGRASTVIEGDGKQKRFRLSAPDPWAAVALVLALVCFIRELPEVIGAARASAGFP